MAFLSWDSLYLLYNILYSPWQKRNYQIKDFDSHSLIQYIPDNYDLEIKLHTLHAAELQFALVIMLIFVYSCWAFCKLCFKCWLLFYCSVQFWFLMWCAVKRTKKDNWLTKKAFFRIKVQLLKRNKSLQIPNTHVQI